MARRIGHMTKRVDFFRLDGQSDGPGRPSTDFEVVPFLKRIAANWRPEKMSESQEAGRQQSEVGGRLTMRNSAALRSVTTNDKLNFDGHDYQIQAIEPPAGDIHSQYLEFRVVRGVAI